MTVRLNLHNSFAEGASSKSGQWLAAKLFPGFSQQMAEVDAWTNKFKQRMK